MHILTSEYDRWRDRKDRKDNNEELQKVSKPDPVSLKVEINSSQPCQVKLCQWQQSLQLTTFLSNIAKSFLLWQETTTVIGNEKIYRNN